MSLTIKNQLELAEYTKYNVSNSIKRYIKYQEKDLDRVCRKIWQHENPQGILYMYANFCRNYDKVIVTIAYFNENLNLFVPMEIGK